MTERGLKSGRILVYGSNTDSCFPAFGAAVKEYYPQFDTVSFNRTPGSGDDGAIDELSDYLLNNRDIKGLYACDESSVPVAVKARSKAIAAFKDIEAAEKASEGNEKKRAGIHTYVGTVSGLCQAHAKSGAAQADIHNGIRLRPK